MFPAEGDSNAPSGLTGDVDIRRLRKVPQQARAAAQSQIFAARVQAAQAAKAHKDQVNTIRLQREQIRLAKAAMPKAPPSFSKRLTSFVRTSRFGGGGIEPLVGKGLDLLGDSELAEVAGPVGLLAAAAISGAKAIKSFTDQTSQTAAAFQRLRLSTGGIPSNGAIKPTWQGNQS